MPDQQGSEAVSKPTASGDAPPSVATLANSVSPELVSGLSRGTESQVQIPAGEKVLE